MKTDFTFSYQQTGRYFAQIADGLEDLGAAAIATRGAGDIHLVAWIVAFAVMLLYQFVTRQLAIPAPPPDPLWERSTMPLYAATHKQLTCRLPEEANE